MRVDQVMHDSPETLTPDHRIEDALAMYRKTGVNCVPIIGPAQAPVGILTIFQVVDALKAGITVDAPIRTVMDQNIVSVRNNEQFEVVCRMPMERLLVLDEHDKLVGVLTKMELIQKVYHAFDTAERRTFELQKIIDCAMEGILILDREGAELSRNQRFRELMPGWSGEGKAGLTGAAGIIAKGIADCLAEGKPFTRLIEEEERRMVLAISPLYSPEGAVFRYVLTLRDLTEIDALRREADRRKREIEVLRTARFEEEPPVSASPVMTRLFHQAERAGRVDSTILITGETGVGKEILAMHIHRHSPRRSGPLIQINCGAIPEHLQESELFGYEKGAFTGADRGGRIGMFEVASGGTLMLDEVGEMCQSLQVSLLRALQEGIVYRIGGRTPIRVDVRIIAMTNRDLSRMVEEKTFREDLFYRLNVVPLTVPPLRERPEDIIPLAEHFLSHFSRKLRHGFTLSEEQRELLRAYPWPGNVRELANIMERLVVLSGMEESTRSVWDSLARRECGPQVDQTCEAGGLRESLRRFERGQIEAGLRQGRTLRGAARLLGIPHSTLVRKMKQFGLAVQE